MEYVYIRDYLRSTINDLFLEAGVFESISTHGMIPSTEADLDMAIHTLAHTIHRAIDQVRCDHDTI